MTPFTRLCFVLALCFLSISPSAAQPEESRSLTVHVTVRDHQGTPIPAVGLRAMLNMQNQRADRRVVSTQTPITNENGEAVVEAVVPAAAAAIDIITTAAVRMPLTAPENRGATTRYFDLKRLHSFQSRYAVPLVAGQDHYTLTISARPSVTVSGRLIDAEGQPLASGGAIARSCECTTGSDRDGPTIGTFQLVGVPRGETVQMRLSGHGRHGRFLQLTVEQTQADIDLGDIVLDPIVGPAKARLQLPPENPPRPDSIAMWTLVSEDGATIITVIVDNADGRPRTPWLEPGQGWLLPGRYYVIPNSIGFGGDDTGWLLLDLIRAGKADDHPELISFVAAANEEAAVALDPEEINARIKAAAQTEGMLSE